MRSTRATAASDRSWALCRSCSRDPQEPTGQQINPVGLPTHGASSWTRLDDQRVHAAQVVLEQSLDHRPLGRGLDGPAHVADADNRCGPRKRRRSSARSPPARLPAAPQPRHGTQSAARSQPRRACGPVPGAPDEKTASHDLVHQSPTLEGRQGSSPGGSSFEAESRAAKVLERTRQVRLVRGHAVAFLGRGSVNPWKRRSSGAVRPAGALLHAGGAASPPGTVVARRSAGGPVTATWRDLHRSSSSRNAAGRTTAHLRGEVRHRRLPAGEVSRSTRLPRAREAIASRSSPARAGGAIGKKMFAWRTRPAIHLRPDRAGARGRRRRTPLRGHRSASALRDPCGRKCLPFDPPLHGGPQRARVRWRDRQNAPRSSRKSRSVARKRRGLSPAVRSPDHRQSERGRVDRGSRFNAVSRTDGAPVASRGSRFVGRHALPPMARAHTPPRQARRSQPAGVPDRQVPRSVRRASSEAM